jgi:hypothetical protein
VRAVGKSRFAAAVVLARRVGEPPCVASDAVGVGKDEDALSLVRSADVGSANATPRRVIPQRGQVSQDLGKRSSSVDSKETWDVLQERVAGS